LQEIERIENANKPLSPSSLLFRTLNSKDKEKVLIYFLNKVLNAFIPFYIIDSLFNTLSIGTR